MAKLNTSLQLGFTLIEVMVALFIVSFTVVAVIDITAKHTHITSELEKRQIALMVASNEIAEQRYLAKRERVREGGDKQTVEMGGLRWRVTSVFSETEVERVFLLEVEVKNDLERDKAPYASLTTAITDRL